MQHCWLSTCRLEGLLVTLWPWQQSYCSQNQCFNGLWNPHACSICSESYYALAGPEDKFSLGSLDTACSVDAACPTHVCSCFSYPHCSKTSNLPNPNKPKYWFAEAGKFGGNEESFCQRVPEVWTTERELLTAFARLSQLLQCIAGKKTKLPNPPQIGFLTLHQSSSMSCYHSPNASLPLFEETWHLAFLQRPLTEGHWPSSELARGPSVPAAYAGTACTGRAIHCLSQSKLTPGAVLILLPSLLPSPNEACPEQLAGLSVALWMHQSSSMQKFAVGMSGTWCQEEVWVRERCACVQVLGSCPTCLRCHFPSPLPATVHAGGTGMWWLVWWKPSDCMGKAALLPHLWSIRKMICCKARRLVVPDTF